MRESQLTKTQAYVDPLRSASTKNTHALLERHFFSGSLRHHYMEAVQQSLFLLVFSYIEHNSPSFRFTRNIDPVAFENLLAHVILQCA